MTDIWLLGRGRGAPLASQLIGFEARAMSSKPSSATHHLYETTWRVADVRCPHGCAAMVVMQGAAGCASFCSERVPHEAPSRLPSGSAVVVGGLSSAVPLDALSALEAAVSFLLVLVVAGSPLGACIGGTGYQ